MANAKPRGSGHADEPSVAWSQSTRSAERRNCNESTKAARAALVFGSGGLAGWVRLRALEGASDCKNKSEG